MANSLDDLPTESFCILPWTSASVNSIGNVAPCCLWHNGTGPAYEYASDVGGLPRIQDGIENARKGKLFQKVRQDMLEGKRPSGCAKCWRDEDEANGNKVNDKFGKLHQRLLHQQRYIDSSPYGKITTFDDNPTKIRFLETGISNLCNFACVMCNPSASSQIRSVIYPGKKVPDPLIIKGVEHRGIKKGFHEDNDNIDDDLSELQLLKFVGGEPMLEKKHGPLLEKVVNQCIDPSNLEIEYHTNASVFPDDKIIKCWEKLKLVRIIFSLDGVGDKATLQRPGRYVWQDIEDTVDKYVSLSGIPIVFSANITMTALNIGQVTDICDWLWNKLENSHISWFNLNPIEKNNFFKYIDFRNLSEQTKQRIKTQWQTWERSNPPALKTNIKNIYRNAKAAIDEKGEMDEPLTREIMLERYPYAKLWRHFGEDLSRLDI